MAAVQSVNYGCSALVGLNKKGILKPDADGYYEITVGGFNIHNNSGAYYPLGMAAQLFEESSILMRRIKASALRGEYGHPRRGSMSASEFVKRLNDIYEDRVCCHFGDVRLDYKNYKSKSGFPQVAVIAKLKPSGPFGDALQKSLDNPKEEVCFSVRAAVMQEMVGGEEHRHTRDIVTWDYVNEGGIPIARKYFSIGLESHEGQVFAMREQVESLIVTPTVLQIAAEKAVQVAGLESNDAQVLLDLQRRLGWTRPAQEGFRTPRSLNWR